MNVIIPKQEIYYIKIKAIAFIINSRKKKSFAIERCTCKSKKGSSVSEKLALFKSSSGGEI